MDTFLVLDNLYVYFPSTYTNEVIANNQLWNVLNFEMFLLVEIFF